MLVYIDNQAVMQANSLPLQNRYTCTSETTKPADMIFRSPNSNAAFSVFRIAGSA